VAANRSPIQKLTGLRDQSVDLMKKVQVDIRELLEVNKQQLEKPGEVELAELGL